MTTLLAKTIIILIAVSAPLLSSANLGGGSHSYWISRTHDNLNKIENYTAVIEQTHSNSPDKVVSQLLFKKPHNFHLTVSQPSHLTGFEAGFNDHAILLHNPNTSRAIKLEGLKSPTSASRLEQVKNIYWYNNERYEQVFKPSINIAERLSVGLDFIAKDSDSEITKVNSFADYHHSIFMQASYSFSSGITSKFTHTEMAFNQEQISLPSLRVPKKTDMLFWDFNRASLSDKQARERISTDIRWPLDKDDIWSFGQHQFYQQTNSQTAAAYFYNDAFFMIALTQPAETKKELLEGTPLLLNKTKVQFAQWPSFSDLTFELNGIHYILISNIHPQSLIDMAKGMLSEEESGEGFYLTNK